MEARKMSDPVDNEDKFIKKFPFGNLITPSFFNVLNIFSMRSDSV